MRNLIALIITGLVERIEWLHRCRRHDIGTKLGKIVRIRRGHRFAAPKLSQAKLEGARDTIRMVQAFLVICCLISCEHR